MSDIENEKHSLVIILGDLLTYGTEPNQTIDLLLNFSKEHDCVFLKGNHDQFYFDMDRGLNPFNYYIPDFIKESILWTKKKLKFKIENCFDWHEKYQIKELFFSHANPYDFPNWTYLNNSDEVIKSSIHLNKMNAKVGVFGHTHRKKS